MAASDNGLMADLLWSDPNNENVHEWELNPRGAGWLFSENVTKKFLRNNKLEKIIRSHQLVMEGFTYMHDNKLLSIFSAPNYVYR